MECDAGWSAWRIIAYAGNDVLYYPGWLSKSVHLLETFPNVGMITSRLSAQTDLYSSTVAWAEMSLMFSSSTAASSPGKLSWSLPKPG